MEEAGIAEDITALNTTDIQAGGTSHHSAHAAWQQQRAVACAGLRGLILFARAARRAWCLRCAHLRITGMVFITFTL